MQTARRLYVYLLSGISLAALVAGLTMLLGVLLKTLGLGPSGVDVFGGEETVRQQLTLGSALTAVSLPVWLIHWFLAERSVRPDRSGSALERNSGIRGLYFALAMALLLATMATALVALVRELVLALSDASTGFGDTPGDLARAIVSGAAWNYHVALRTRDWSRGPLAGGGAWLPRLYLYGATFGGLILLLLSTNGLIELGGRMLLDRPPEFVGGESGSWWALALATGLSGVLVGGATWVGHWAYAAGLVRDDEWRGASERPARLRLAYFVLVTVVAASAVLYFVGTGIGEAVAAALGVSEASDSRQVIGLVVLPLLSSLPFGLAWSLHARWLSAEAAASASSERRETADRLLVYPVSLVALAFGAVALALLIGLGLDVPLGGNRVLSGEDSWRRELSQLVPLAVLGWAVWIWCWSDVTRRATVDPAGESASATRRSALLLVLAIAVIAGIASAGFALYRLFGALFGVNLTGNAMSELSVPIGVLLVAAAIATYHGVALRRDQAIRVTLEPPGEDRMALPIPVAILRLSGSPGGDLEGTIAALRAQLPAGYALEVDPTSTSS